MLIVDGPDGGGKTTLINRLRRDTGMPIHSRASDSVEGPVKDLYAWTVNDMETWGTQPLAIYDRHPLISEPIYGPTVRGDVRPGFDMMNPELSLMRRILRRNALVILCLPPKELVRENVASDIAQMAGVVENIEYIYDCYRMMLDVWPIDAHITRYDYTARPDDPNGYTGILAAAQHHKYSWRGNR